MRQTLILHPRDLCPAVERIEVDISRSEADLLLRYRVTGNIAALRLPPLRDPVRRHGLWLRTCFEAFVGTESNYLELNLSPSSAWAAYRFAGVPTAGRRLPRCNAGIDPPEIRTESAYDWFELGARVHILRWEGRLGLAAIIKERDGSRSHWALAHPPGKPDFHHPDCFAAELPRW